MKSKKAKLFIAILLLILFLILGGTYTFLSYDFLVKLGIAFGFSSLTLKIIGISLLVLGVILFLLTLLTDFLKKVNKVGKKYWYFLVLFDIFKWIIIVILGFIILYNGTQVTQSLLG